MADIKKVPDVPDLTPEQKLRRERLIAMGHNYRFQAGNKAAAAQKNHVKQQTQEALYWLGNQDIPTIVRMQEAVDDPNLPEDIRFKYLSKLADIQYSKAETGLKVELRDQTEEEVNRQLGEFLEENIKDPKVKAILSAFAGVDENAESDEESEDE